MPVLNDKRQKCIAAREIDAVMRDYANPNVVKPANLSDDGIMRLCEREQRGLSVDEAVYHQVVAELSRIDSMLSSVRYIQTIRP